MTTTYEFIIWSDTPGSNALEVEALTYSSWNEQGLIPANSFVIIEDGTQARIWFGQVIEPQRNLPRGLSKDNPNSVSALEKVLADEVKESVFLEQYHYYRVKLIGEVTKGHVESVRVRPRYGSKGRRATLEEVVAHVKFPELLDSDGCNNALGVIKDSEIPVCVDKKRIFYHTLLAGATGGGKSNTIGNLIKSAQALGMGCIVIDQKPDYQDMHLPNTERQLFEDYDPALASSFGLKPVKYFCLHSQDDYRKNVSERPIAIRASDASHEMLAASLFYRHGEELQREAFFRLLEHFQEDNRQRGKGWTLKEFLEWVGKHKGTSKTGKADWTQLADYFDGETPNEKVMGAMLSRISTRKPAWMDAETRTAPKTGIFKEMASEEVAYFDPLDHLTAGGVLVIRRPQSSSGREYGLFLSYLLRRVYDIRRLQKIDFHLMMVIDEAQDVFAGDSMLKSASERTLNEVMRKGRSKGLGFVVAVQSASQLPQSIINNLNTSIIHRQNSEEELRTALPGVPKDMLRQVVNFASGEAIVRMYGVSAPVHAQMFPSPFELTKEDFEK